MGVYAIPTSDWSSAINNGWPIVSETGGLGTQAAPWVGFTSAKSVATSPDFLLGQSIYNSHKRVTWLSFWTLSGPLKTEPQTAASYYSHGFAAGAWVAGEIDQYRALGVGLLSGGYGREELESSGALRVYEDPRDLLRHLDEIASRHR